MTPGQPRASSGTKSPFTARRSLLAYAWAAALLLAAAAWVFSSPVGASPDEPSHLAYAWSVATFQGFGDPDPSCATEPCPRFDVDVPPGLIPEPACYAFKPSQHAGCAGPSAQDPYPSYMTRYPPPYYFLVGSAMRLMNGLDAGPSAIAYAGRVAAAIVSAAFLIPAGAIVVVRRPRTFAYFVAPLTAMSMFMIGSVNPSGIEIAAAVAAGVAILQLSLDEEPRTRLLFAASVFALAWARPVGWLWAGSAIVFGVAAVAILSGGWRAAARRFGWSLVVALASTIAAMGWFIYALGARSVGGSGTSMPESMTEQALALVLRWGGMAYESVGVLGWLDTPLPDILILVTAGLVGYLIVVGFGRVSVANGMGLLIGYVVVIGVGVTVIMVTQDFLWQGRYVLPAFGLGMGLLAAISYDPDGDGPARYVASALWAIAAASALWVNARYAFGLEIGLRYTVPAVDSGAFWRGPLHGFVLAGLVLTSIVLVGWIEGKSRSLKSLITRVGGT